MFTAKVQFIIGSSPMAAGEMKSDEFVSFLITCLAEPSPTKAPASVVMRTPFCLAVLILHRLTTLLPAGESASDFDTNMLQ